MKFIHELINFEVEEKTFKRILILLIILLMLIILIIFLSIGMMHKYTVPKDIDTTNDGKIEYKIDSIATGRKYIEIKGWAYRTGKNIGYFDNKYIIRNESTLEYKALNTQMTIVEEFFSIEEKYDCRRAGMYAKSLAIGLAEGLYQIFIEYKSDNENLLIDTGIFFNYGM